MLCWCVLCDVPGDIEEAREGLRGGGGSRRASSNGGTTRIIKDAIPLLRIVCRQFDLWKLAFVPISISICSRMIKTLPFPSLKSLNNPSRKPSHLPNAT
ncbi:hypothetical protein PUN28_012492 [Cardiocondyla obscurior]|uniref:Uncharacterized protein n=1 Tax=Cardiocondyla obscurior TaxID=286306 RepID=A0AAW2FCZ7_9HYME